MSKLTLSTDSETILLAKKYAKQNNTSVSAMFSRYVHGLQEQMEDGGSVNRGSSLAKLSGVINVDDNVSYDDLRKNALEKKYGVKL